MARDDAVSIRDRLSGWDTTGDLKVGLLGVGYRGETYLGRGLCVPYAKLVRGRAIGSARVQRDVGSKVVHLDVLQADGAADLPRVIIHSGVRS